MHRSSRRKNKKRVSERFRTDTDLFCKLLCFAACLGSNLNTLVVTACIANTVSEDRLAALRALYDVCRSLKLPYARTSLHLSSMRSFSLWYCHCCLPPELSCRDGISRTLFFYSLLFFFISSRIFLSGARRGSISFLPQSQLPSFKFLPHLWHSPLQSSLQRKREGNSISS